MSALTEWKNSIEDRIATVERHLLALTTSVQDSIREGEVHVHDVKQQHANHESRILGIGAAVRILEDFARHFDIAIVDEMANTILDHGTRITMIEANNAQERARQDLTDRRLLRIEDAMGKGIIDPDPDTLGGTIRSGHIDDQYRVDERGIVWRRSIEGAEGNQREGGHGETPAYHAMAREINDLNKNISMRDKDILELQGREHDLYKALKEVEAAHENCEEKLYDATTSRDAWKQNCKNTEILYEERIRRYNQLETDLAQCRQVAERCKEDTEILKIACNDLEARWMKRGEELDQRDKDAGRYKDLNETAEFERKKAWEVAEDYRQDAEKWNAHDKAQKNRAEILSRVSEDEPSGSLAYTPDLDASERDTNDTGYPADAALGAMVRRMPELLPQDSDMVPRVELTFTAIGGTQVWQVTDPVRFQPCTLTPDESLKAALDGKTK